MLEQTRRSSISWTLTTTLYNEAWLYCDSYLLNTAANLCNWQTPTVTWRHTWLPQHSTLTTIAVWLETQATWLAAWGQLSRPQAGWTPCPTSQPTPRSLHQVGTHNTQHPTPNTQHTTHNTQHTTHNTQHTTHNTQHNTTHNMTLPDRFRIRGIGINALV